MPDELKTPEEKLKLLGERLREGAAKIRPVPKQVLDDALKPNQGLEQDETQKSGLKKRRRRGPSR
jgi:hypothetical protein